MSAGDGDKRKVSTDALETLGTAPISDDQKRDAIHLAVEPVVAGHALNPGEHVSVIDGVAWGAARGKGLGIVDPFLIDTVKTGQRFWFVMYPRMVHSLRHVWAHPAFPDEAVATTPAQDPAASHVQERRKVEAEAWLRDYCDGSNFPSFEAMIAVLRDGIWQDQNSGDFIRLDEYAITSYGHDASGAIPPELWGHAETYLGIEIGPRPEYFSCSC